MLNASRELLQRVAKKLLKVANVRSRFVRLRLTASVHAERTQHPRRLGYVQRVPGHQWYARHANTHLNCCRSDRSQPRSTKRAETSKALHFPRRLLLVVMDGWCGSSIDATHSLSLFIAGVPPEHLQPPYIPVFGPLLERLASMDDSGPGMVASRRDPHTH